MQLPLVDDEKGRLTVEAMTWGHVDTPTVEMKEEEKGLSGLLGEALVAEGLFGGLDLDDAREGGEDGDGDGEGEGEVAV